MSTHVVKCIACERDCYCCSDLHALGIGGWGLEDGRHGKKGSGGCFNVPQIEFCSTECFKEFRSRFEPAWKNYMEFVQ